jgi:hypothetical protein
MADPGVWPFLVGAGRRRGLRSILLPDWLAQRRLGALLRDGVILGNDETTTAWLRTRHPEIGEIVMCYRTEAIHEGALDERPWLDLPVARGDPLRDQFQRPLRVAFGLVSRGRPGTWAERDMQTARYAGLTAYRRFLTDEVNYTYLTSEALPPGTTAKADDRRYWPFAVDRRLRPIVVPPWMNARTLKRAVRNETGLMLRTRTVPGRDLVVTYGIASAAGSGSDAPEADLEAAWAAAQAALELSMRRLPVRSKALPTEALDDVRAEGT